MRTVRADHKRNASAFAGGRLEILHGRRIQAQAGAEGWMGGDRHGNWVSFRVADFHADVGGLAERDRAGGVDETQTVSRCPALL